MARNRDSERTMAEAEQDAREQPGSETRCICGSQRFVLEAYLEVEALTCPECGREYEPILTGNGRVLRGEFRGYFDDDEG
ncbi:MAG: hypothetical protein E6J88_10535 [Deltaproteobacteria bacterium]|nr:MAG: hypothetical protein E6J88_10535 [Deltaproteobacteria bacterium]